MAVWSETSVYEISNTKRIDSEYYHPEYIEAEKIVLQHNVQKLKFLGQFLIGPFGSAFHVSNYDPDSPYRYVRGKDVKPFQLLGDDNVYMPPDDFERLKKYALKTDDLLISVVGTLGNVSIVPENLEGIFSCKSTVFRNSYVEPYFLLAYFNCKYGRKCLLRRQRGAVQTGLNKDDLEQIPVPIFNERIYSELGEKVRKALEKRDISKSLYTKAHELLEKELRLDRLAIEKIKSYETSFSEVINGGRIDGEFHHVKYEPYLKTIMGYEHGFSPLINLIYQITPKFSVSSHKDKLFEYIEIGDVNISDGRYTTQSLKASNLPANAKIILTGGEVLVSLVRPTRGAITIVDDSIENETIASGAFFTFSMKDVLYREITWLFLRVIRNVFEKYCGGTSYPTMDGKYLLEFPIPMFQEKLAKKINVLINQSNQAKKESEQLLAQAKKQVEDLIEGAVK